MDGHQFDDLLRALSRSRRTLVGAALTAAGGVTGLSAIDAKKKKKKPCKKKCPAGCCTGKHGKCIQPGQQSSTQCGTGGEICRSTGCGGGSTTEPPDTCATTCEGCCAGETCFMDNDDGHCGLNGVACFGCADNEECASTHCCGKPGHECSEGGDCCLALVCDEGACCSTFASCTQDADCCRLGTTVICDSGQCVVKTGASCQPGWICMGGFSCPSSGICGDPGDCTIPCQEEDRCTGYSCFGGLYCCPANVTDTCNVPEFICECIVEGGYCTGTFND